MTTREELIKLIADGMTCAGHYDCGPSDRDLVEAAELLDDFLTQDAPPLLATGGVVRLPVIGEDGCTLVLPPRADRGADIGISFRVNGEHSGETVIAALRVGLRKP